jgi:protein TonB
MPHELLGDVLRPGDTDGRARRSWYVLPLSIGAHTVAAAAIVIIPLAAEVELPAPMRPIDRFYNVMLVEPRPVVVSPPRGSASHAAVAPSVAPSGISKEEIAPVVTGSPGPPSLDSIRAADGFEVGVIGDTNVVVAPPAPPPPPPKPVPVGGDIREPEKIVDAAPVYPPLALASGVEGVVILEATLDEHGNVDRLKVLRSAPLLDEAALQAVRRWRYTPTLLNGTPVPVLMTITVRFSLRK